MCPIPTAHTPETALQAFLNAKKNMPGLTPAAWRKQAAIDLGMDYDSYLALWKVHKGSVAVAKKLNIPMTPVSSPTVPAAASNSATMNVVAQATQQYAKAGTSLTVNNMIKLLHDVKIQKQGYGKAKFTHTGQMSGGGSTFHPGYTLVKKVDDEVEISFTPGFSSSNPQQLINIQKKLADEGFTVKAGFNKLTVGKTDFGELVDDADWKPPQGLTVQGELQSIEDAYVAGKVGEDAAVALLKELKGVAPYVSKKIDDLIEQIKPAHQQAIPDGDTLQTAFGPLTHDLAQNVYKKMKKDFPGGTPAQWRHAAAEYLGVDYNDYLKAWKKTTTSAQKKATTPFSKLPDSTDTYVSPTTAGKYANVDISVDQLKDELARLYGPSAQKQYINLSYDDFDGAYKVQFPSSILPTPASKKAVQTGLEKLGLIVEKHGTWYHIKTAKAAKTAANNAKQIKTSGTYTLPDGTIAWDMKTAQAWSDKWFRSLSADQRSAMKSYTGSGYRTMNGNLRKGRAPTAKDKALSSAMQPMDHEFTVFRGTEIDINQFQVGGLWEDKGFMSTAINPGSAWSGVKFEIVIPKGTKGAYVGTNSSVAHENEFIIDMGTKFRIINVDVQRRKVKMVAIPHK
jgi:hypothetical protein